MKYKKVLKKMHKNLAKLDKNRSGCFIERKRFDSKTGKEKAPIKEKVDLDMLKERKSELEEELKAIDEMINLINNL